MELHTLGAENYAGIIRDPDNFANMDLLGHFTAWDGTEERLKYVDDDVYEAARALTGWTVSGSTWPYDPIDGAPLGTFAYDDTNHDQAPKHILARYLDPYQGQGDGTLLFDMLAQHPGTAHFVAGKLCRRFVGDSAVAALVQSVADSLHRNWQAPDQIAQAMQIVLQSTEFKHGWGTKMKRPAMAAVGALRALGADFTPKPDNTSTWTTTEEFISRLQAAGQRLFYWPAPNGYPDVMQALVEHRRDGHDAEAAAAPARDAPGLGLRQHAAVPRRRAGADACRIPEHGRPHRGQHDGLLVRSHPRLPAGADAHDRGRFHAPERRRDAIRSTSSPTASNDHGQPNHTGNWDLNDLSQHYTIARLRTAIALILCSPEFLRR